MKKVFIILLLLVAIGLQAQVSINKDGVDPDGSAMLDVKSTEKGILIPRMSDAERDAIVNPATGLMVFVNTDNSFYYFNGSNWVGLSSLYELNDTVVRLNPNHVDMGNTDFVFGSPQMDDDAIQEHEGRMYFNKTRGAFRAGNVDSTQWDEINVGEFSTAFGKNTTASGKLSFAFGRRSIASGLLSFAAGEDALASGEFSLALGHDASATNLGSVAVGYKSQATGLGAVSLGYGTEAPSAHENTIGIYPTLYTPFSSSIFWPTDRLFTIGNGSKYNRSDALVILKNGNTFINGALTIDNAYTFPTSDGTNGQVLSTDGSGNVSWSTLSGLSDNQDLSLSGNTLSLTNDATPVDLSGYLDNTDAQSLSLNSNTLSLTNGGSVDLSGYSNENVRLIQDADNDTKIDVEEFEDEDNIKFYLAGEPAVTFSSEYEDFSSDDLVTIPGTPTMSDATTDADWQSFMPEEEMNVDYFELYFDVSNCAVGSYTISIYEDIGTSGTLLSSTNVSTPGTDSWVTVDFPAPLILQKEGNYTIAFDNRSGIGYGGNEYSGGQAGSDSSRDYALVVWAFDRVRNAYFNSAIGFVDSYIFPTSDGEAGQVMVTDGTGNVSWSTLSGLSDNQDLSLSGNTLSLTNDATPVDLSGYLDNTDAQALLLNSNTLSLTNGGSVDLSVYDNANTTLVQDADNDTKIQVEESADDDVIRFDVSGSEAFTISKNANGITLLQPDNTTNTILGKDAGLNTNTDDYNTFIGYRAGEDNANYDNTFIGAQAGASSTGFHNLFIGAGTGESATGNGNVFIGYETGYNSSGSNQLYIDNSDTPSPLIYGEFDNDLLRINGMLNINNSFTFPTADGTNGQVLSTDGSGALSWTTLTDSDNQDLSLSGNSLSLTNDATPVDLSGYLDNTDAQALSLSSNTLSLTDGGSVDLSGYVNTDNQDMTLSGNTLSLTNDATTVDLSAYLDNTDAQALSLNSNTLSLTNGGSVDISQYQQSISLNSTTKTLELSDGGSVDLTNYFNDNTVLIQDADNDTKIQVEESADEDVIRFDVAGSEVLSVSGNANGVPRLSIPGANTLINGGINVSTGNRNTYLGLASGTLTTSGSENTYLGVRTGFTSNGSGNVFLGYEAGYNETNSNRLYIDNSSTSNPLIYGEFDNNVVGINGSLGVGAVSPEAKLDVSGSESTTHGKEAAIRIENTATGGAAWMLRAGATGTATPEGGFSVADDGAYRMVINSSGDVGFGTESPESRIHVTDDFASSASFVATVQNTGNGAYSNGLKIQAGQNTLTVNNRFISFVKPNGAEIGAIRQVTSTSVDYNTTSDERLKANITPTTKGLNDLMQIEVSDFVYKDDPDKPQTGFVAQQVYRHYPNAVTPGGDDVKTDPWMMDYGKMTPLLVKSIQDQQEMIERLQNQIKILEAQNSSLTDQNEELRADVQMIKEMLLDNETKASNQITESDEK